MHPNHPLHPGEHGIQLFMGITILMCFHPTVLNILPGTFPSGEARLLFSSKQVDYLRHWLYKMQITKTILPLPYSNCLLVSSELKTISPARYATGGELKKAIKVHN